MINDLTALLDQARMSIRVMAKSLKVYAEELHDAGFNEHDAIYLSGVILAEWIEMGNRDWEDDD